MVASGRVAAEIHPCPASHKRMWQRSSIAATVKARKPARRNGDLDAALDWLRRSLYDAKTLDDDQRDRAESIIREIKTMVAASVAGWRPAAPKRAVAR